MFYFIGVNVGQRDVADILKFMQAQQAFNHHEA